MMNNKQLKTALVTGGARRIGAAIAHDLAKNGFNVAIQYTSAPEEAAELMRAMDEAGVKHASFEADLTDQKNAEQLLEQVRDAIGPIDLLVNNASIFNPDQADDFEMELWEDHFAIHLKAPAILAREFVRQKETSSGLIVNIIDQRVRRLNPTFYSYTLSKSALWTATQTMAQSFAPSFRVNAIGPGPTLQNERQSDEDFQKQLDGLPLRRGPELEEFGRTIRFLYDTPSITGQLIALDGGQHLAWETPDVVGMNE